MSGNERLFATPAGVTLGPLTDIADGAARNFVLQLKAGRFHGFVLRRGDGVFGYVDRCPHIGLPLAQQLDRYLTAEGRYIVCSWHGALFEPESGLCVGGPCAGQRLTDWPVQVVDRHIVTRRGRCRGIASLASDASRAINGAPVPVTNAGGGKR